MPILIFILLVILVAHIGFWDTLTSVLGAIGVVLMLLAILGLLVWACLYYLWVRARRRI